LYSFAKESSIFPAALIKSFAVNTQGIVRNNFLFFIFEEVPGINFTDGKEGRLHHKRHKPAHAVTPANGAGFDGFFGWVLIQVLLDGWKQVTL